MKRTLLDSLDALEAHCRRATAVAALLELCPQEELLPGMLENAAGIIREELRGIRACRERIGKAVRG